MVAQAGEQDHSFQPSQVRILGLSILWCRLFFESVVAGVGLLLQRIIKRMVITVPSSFLFPIIKGQIYRL